MPVNLSEKAQIEAAGSQGRDAPAVEHQISAAVPHPAYSFPPAARRALDRIVEQIDIDLASLPHRVVLVTASRKGDGASTVARWLLSYLASTQSGKMLYVDASMQGGPASASQPAPSGSAGLIAQVRPTGARGIDTLELRETASGRGPALQDVADALAQLREEYTWIIIDAPPPSCFSPRSVFLVQHADGVFLVVEANRTDRDQVRETVDLIRRSGGRVIGALLNKTRV